MHELQRLNQSWVPEGNEMRYAQRWLVVSFFSFFTLILGERIQFDEYMIIYLIFFKWVGSTTN